MDEPAQSQATTEQRFSPQETAVPAAPVLELDIDDEKLVEFIDAHVKNSKTFFDEEKKIKERRERNKKYYFGKQLEDVTVKAYEKKFIDNVIKEGEDQLRPLVLSRLPDLIVKPGTEGDDTSEKSAEILSEAVNKKLKSQELKKILKKAFRHHPVYLTAIIKYRWDPQKGRFGDIAFEVIHPTNVLMDSSATKNDQEEMKIIVHYVEKSLKDWIMLFPSKEKDLTEFAQSKGKFSGSLDEKAMAVNIKVAEVWFDWSEKEENFDPENPKFKFMSGVCWKVGKKILDKKLNPNWDWEGSEEMFFNGQPVPDELIPQLAMMGLEVPGIERKKVFRNFFSKPRKPFIFLGYEQWGEMPLDETSRVEENIYLQDNYDKRGMQVTKMIDDARGKHAFSTLSGLKKETIEAMDLSDPDEDIVIDGDLREVHSFITKEQPSQAMFADLARSRERMLARVHVHGATRGELESDVATTNQIAREADFTSADEISDDMVVDVATEMAEALLHMMKLRYTPEHFSSIVGTKGQETFNRFVSDMIEDGMEVDIFASGTDKLRAEREAKEEAKLQLIDPLTYYKDTGRSDPKGRAEKLFLFLNAPELYYKKFVEGEDVVGIAEQVALINQQNLAAAGVPGQPPAPPMRPSPQAPGQIPPTPAGSPRSLIGRATGAISRIFGGGV